MQPFTPAFFEKMQPATPVPEPKMPGTKAQKDVAAAAEALGTGSEDRRWLELAQKWERRNSD